MLDLNALAHALGGEVSAGQILCPGPGHSAADRSLAVRPSPTAGDGFVVHSFADDDPIACRDFVRERLSLSPWRPEAATAARGKRIIAAEYVYRNESGQPFLKVIRYEPKGFAQQFWSGAAWKWGRPPGDPIPYRLPELLATEHDICFVVEGEKDADALAAIGLTATTAPEGAGKWSPALSRWFSHRCVYVLPDNDPPGRRHAEDVARALQGIAREVRVVDLPGLPPKGDVSDWLAGGGTADALAQLCEATLTSADAPPTAPEAQPEASQRLLATPFLWCDPAAIPPREWLYGRFLIRRQVSLTVAPGGVGKSSLVAVEALSQATGRTLLHDTPHGRSVVWLWNGEDPMDELQRRIMAACMRYGISSENIDGNLFVNSGRETEIIIARVDPRNGVTIAEPVFDALVETIRQRKIDVVTIDPFVSCHQVPENDNGAIDRVAKTYARIADITGSAIHLVHHSRKTGGAAVEIEDGRGAVALIAAARAARTLNTMTEDEAARAGVESRYRYVRIDDGKANLAPRCDSAKWLCIDGQPLGNGDDIAVVTAWRWPDPFDGITTADLLVAQRAVAAGRWRENVQAKDWVGIPIAHALKRDLSRPADKQAVKTILRTWIDNGMFARVVGKDKNHEDRTFVEVGTWATE